MKVLNAQGTIFYGMHFYPGVAEYAAPDKEAYRVFLNENTIRKMGPTFAGRPVFVEHVEEVEGSVDELRKEADGWVIESFYNSADGKHWAKFIVVSEKALRAIKQGFCLSNAYYPTQFTQGGLWNGVSYQREVTDGEFEHLAIVKNPRYEESVIMTPEEFKKYNDDKLVELERFANSKEKETQKMKLSFFKRAKVENAIDPELSVQLPKSGREVTIIQLINEADEHAEDKKKENGDMMAHPEHKVKLHDGSECSVNDLVEKHKAIHDELEAMKQKNAPESEGELEIEPKKVDVESVPAMENDEDEKKKLELKEAKEKEVEEAKKKNAADEAAKAAAKEKAEKLKNAPNKYKTEAPRVELSEDRVARGKVRYGSN